MKIKQFNDVIDAMHEKRTNESALDPSSFLPVVDEAFEKVLYRIAQNQSGGIPQQEIRTCFSLLEKLWQIMGNSIHELHMDRKEVADSKRGDYTRGDSDVFANFKNQSESLDLRPEQCLAVHMEKQYSAIVNYINTDGESESEPILKRFGDTMNYLELLYGIFVEKEKASNPLIFESICIDGEEFDVKDFTATPDDAIHHLKTDAEIFFEEVGKVFEEDRIAGYGNRNQKRCDFCNHLVNADEPCSLENCPQHEQK